MVLAGTSLNYLINLGAIVVFLGVIIAILPLTDETGNSVTCNVSKNVDITIVLIHSCN